MAGNDWDARPVAACLRNMRTDLVLLDALSGPRRVDAEARLGMLDVEVAGSLTGANLVAENIRRAPLSSWLLLCSGDVAGVFALAPTPRPGFDLQASIYLVGRFRGRRLFSALYLAAGAAATAEHLAVCSSVEETNLRSLAAHRKVFGDYRPPVSAGVRYPQLRFAVHDLRELPADLQAYVDQGLVRAIRAGLSASPRTAPPNVRDEASQTLPAGSTTVKSVKY